MKKYKISFFVILVFIFLFFGLVKLSNCMKNKKINDIKNSYINSFSEKHGAKIQKTNYTEYNYNRDIKSTINTNSVVDPVKLQFEKSKNIKNVNPINNINIRIVSNIILGRYDIRDFNEIDTVKFYIKTILEKNVTSSKTINIDEITLCVSRELFKIVKDPMIKIQIGQYIINKSINNIEIQNVYKSIISIASDNKLSINTRMNAIDVLYLSNNSKYIEISKQLLKQIRNTENTNTRDWFNKRLNEKIRKLGGSIVSSNTQNQNTQNVREISVQNSRINRQEPREGVHTQDTFQAIYNVNVQVKKPVKSIYQDGQNIHDTSINNSVLETANELIQKYTPNSIMNFDYTLISGYSEEDKMKIEASLHRIMTDTSNFKHGTTLYKLFQSLLCFISKNTQKDELNKRLIEELIDMYKTCATGHLSRMINVLQGFDTNLKQKISIDIDSEMYAKVKFIIEREIQNTENSDDIIDDMLTDDKLLYIDFVKNIFKNKKKEIYKEYENIKDDIKMETSLIKSLDKYTGTTGNFTDI